MRGKGKFPRKTGQGTLDHFLRPARLLQAEKALLTGDAAGVARAAAFFGLEADRAVLHCQMLQDICRQRGVQLASLQDVVTVLRDSTVRAILPDSLTYVKLLLTPPATSCSAERSFSLLRRLKTYLRSTLIQERLCQAAVLASYPERLDKLDMEEEMRRFVAETPQRTNAFGRW